MIKELKYFLFLFVITLIFFLSLKYYFSDDNKKNYYRSYKQMDKKIIKYAQNLILLKSDTTNTVEYIERAIDKNKKNYTFWKLINDNE
jgi:cbb3-type cytochrome oxidase subunit 3